jgi:hypothetical protein
MIKTCGQTKPSAGGTAAAVAVGCSHRLYHQGPTATTWPPILGAAMDLGSVATGATGGSVTIMRKELRRIAIRGRYHGSKRSDRHAVAFAKLDESDAISNDLRQSPITGVQDGKALVDHDQGGRSQQHSKERS